MPSRFQAAAARASAAIDGVMGEAVRIEPRIEKALGAVADPQRQPIEAVVGVILSGDGDLGFLYGDKRRTDFASRVSNQEMWISFTASAFDDTWKPRKGDLLIATDRGGTKYKLTTPFDGSGRLVYQLVYE